MSPSFSHPRTAITGGIAEGKSTVLRMLSERGYRIASADEAARAAFREDETNDALSALIRAEPPITGAELSAALAQAAEEGNDALRRRVNAIMHPGVRVRMEAEGAEFDEVPLLLEACLQGRYDEVWVVCCSPEEKLARLRDRYGEGGFAAIVEAQLPGPVREAFADRIITTDGGLEDTARQVDAALANREKFMPSGVDGAAE
ncbi:dephospho-CoA kinase [bacterium]|nr:MAG: dephospho-CoA kinase [bacterium]